MLTTAHTPHGATDIFDARKAAADLEALAKDFSGRERELRTAVAQRLKAALTEGRAKAEELLLKDRHGRRCAERLCLMQDEIIRINTEARPFALQVALLVPLLAGLLGLVTGFRMTHAPDPKPSEAAEARS